jgi:hypothetical protein
MKDHPLGGIAGGRRGNGLIHSAVTLLLAGLALAVTLHPLVAAAQEAKPVAAPTTPSEGKALICIYRVYRFTGSASHDNLFVNGVFLARLLNSEYACTETVPGTVIISGLTNMYYGSIIQSAGAALNDATKKENERIRFEAEAGKTYYFKWTADPMATGVKVKLMDAAVGAKEMSKLHPSKPPEAKDDEKEAGK